MFFTVVVQGALSVLLFFLMLLVNALFALLWLLLGSLAYSCRLLCHQRVLHGWLIVWNGGEEVDERADAFHPVRNFHRAALAHLLFESMPQLIVQSINSSLIENFTPTAILSLAITSFMICRLAYKFFFYMVRQAARALQAD
jgi:hypothetical protein